MNCTASLSESALFSPNSRRCVALVMGLLFSAVALGQVQKNEPNPEILAPSVAPNAANLYKRLASSVFVAEALNAKEGAVAFGSGVSIAPDQIVTNRHVVEDGQSWRVRQGDKTWPAQISYLDAKHDLPYKSITGQGQLLLQYVPR